MAWISLTAEEDVTALKTTGDLQLMKQLNKGLLLDTVRDAGPVSRSELSVRTGLNKSTVSSLIAEWIEERLIQEVGQGESSGGRKPVLCEFDRGAGYAVGVDVGIREIALVLTDLNGHTLKTLDGLPVGGDPQEAAAGIAQAVRRIARHMPDCPYGLIGVGVGVPGIVDTGGTILSAPNLGWREVPFLAQLEAKLNVPVVLDNEANAGALAERRYGQGVGTPDFVYISVGYGIGTGIFVDGRLYRGGKGLSGEWGHMSIRAEGLPCSCGSRGCWELYASEQALRRGGTAAQAGRDSQGEPEPARFAAHSQPRVPTVADFVRWAEEDRPGVREAWRQIGTNLGIGIVNLLHGLNPDAVILGNRMAAGKKWMAASLNHAVARLGMPYHAGGTAIRFSELGELAGALGAATLAIDRFLADAKAGRITPSGS